MNGSGSDSENDIEEIIENDIEETAEKALSMLLPEKSKEKYQKAYDNFKQWCSEKKVTELTEKVMVAYFTTALTGYKSSSTWSIYSMLRCTLSRNDNHDISDYQNLRSLLKRKGAGYTAKKSNVLNKEEFMRFLKEAPDYEFLVTKVIRSAKKCLNVVQNSRIF